MIARNGEVRIAPSPSGVATIAVEALLAVARTRAGAAVALSGGSTPKAMYDHLRKLPEARDLVASVHYFFGDERSVPNDHADSNVRLAQEGFLRELAVPADHIHAPNGGASDLAAEAARLTAELRRLVPSGTVPVLDLVYLGMGTDGHTASLFPGTAALASETAGFVANDVPQLGTRRLTLTYPVLNAARWLMILCTGANKAEVLREIFSRAEGAPAVYPIERLSAERITWVLDTDAAALLPSHIPVKVAS